MNLRQALIDITKAQELPVRTTRTLYLNVCGADVELDQCVRLLYVGDRYEPADYYVEDLELRVNDWRAPRLERYPSLVRAVANRGKQL